ncbi:MAG: prolyl oligopeptidase family serine peptidase, partial [Bacteroidaceae bacterium]|nr:prolyl oligopeptidase family serine peptidase [Bacteroidaceae bacterium]
LKSIQSSLSDGASDTTESRKEWENLVFTCSERELTSERMNRDSIQALINTCSPVALIDSLSPPTILAYGEQDEIVKPAIYHSVEAALRSHNVPYTLIVFPHSGHGLDNDRDCVFQLQAAVKEYIARYFK